MTPFFGSIFWSFNGPSRLLSSRLSFRWVVPFLYEANLRSSQWKSQDDTDQKSRSRLSPKHDARRADSERLHSPSPPKRPRISDEHQSALSSILNDLKRSPRGLKSPRMHEWHLETCRRESRPPKLSVAFALSVLAYSDEDLMSDQEGSVTAFRPPSRANEPPTRLMSSRSWVHNGYQRNSKACKEVQNRRYALKVRQK